LKENGSFAQVNAITWATTA